MAAGRRRLTVLLVIISVATLFVLPGPSLLSVNPNESTVTRQHSTSKVSVPPSSGSDSRATRSIPPQNLGETGVVEGPHGVASTPNTEHEWIPLGQLPNIGNSNGQTGGVGSDASYAYDAKDGYVLAFGGDYNYPNSVSYPTQSSWAYQDGLWTELEAPAHGPGDWASMQCYQYHNGVNTSNLVPCPNPRSSASMVYDPADGYVVLFGGMLANRYFGSTYGWRSTELNDTWTYSGGNWTRIQWYNYSVVMTAIYASTTEGLAPLSVSFNGQSAGGYGNWQYSGFYSYLWNFGDGTNSTSQDSVHVYQNPGTYTATLTVTDLLGEHSTTSRVVHVLSSDSIFVSGITTNGGQFYAPYNGAFYGQADQGSSVNWNWSFGDGNNSSGSTSSVNHVYTRPGNYTVSLTATNTSSKATSNYSVLITVVPAVVPGPQGPVGESANTANLAYDASDGYVVFPAVQNNPNGNGSFVLQVFSHGHWGWASLPSQPSWYPSAGDPMTYDGAGNFVFSGMCCQGTPGTSNYGTGWYYYHNGDWWNGTSPTDQYWPLPRFNGPLAYDPNLGGIVLYGGSCDTPYAKCQFLGDTWLYTTPSGSQQPGTWTELYSSGCYVYQNGVNTTATGQCPPLQSWNSYLVYDPADSMLLLFDTPAVPNQPEIWALITQNLATPGVSSSQTVVGHSVNFSEPAASGWATYSKFFWQGLPPGCSSANLSILSCTPTVAGNYSVYVKLEEFRGSLVGWTNTSSVQLIVHPALSLSPLLGHLRVDLRENDSFRAGIAGGLGPFAVTWDFGDGNTNTAVNATYAYTSVGNYSVRLWVNDSLLDSVNMTFSVEVVSALSATLALSSPAPLLAQTVAIEANATGGTPPYSWKYSGLPYGCYSQNKPTIGCLPTQAGWYNLSVLVRDANNGTANVTVTMHVIFDFNVVVPADTPLGKQLTIMVNTNQSFNASSLQSYGVQFNETGLPKNTTWSVTLDGINEKANDSSPSGTTLHFAEPNGTYSYTVGSPSGFTSTPSTGTVLVNGPTLPISISFAKVGTPPVSVIKVRPEGGIGAIIYNYSGLPPGCTSEDMSTLVCTPTQAGSYFVTITVKDQAGDHQTHTVPVKIVPGSSLLLGLSGSSERILIVGLVGAVAVLVLAAIVLRRRRAKAPKHSKDGDEPEAATPSTSVVVGGSASADGEVVSQASRDAVKTSPDGLSDTLPQPSVTDATVVATPPPAQPASPLDTPMRSGDLGTLGSTKKCIMCGKRIPLKAKYCPHCEESQE